MNRRENHATEAWCQAAQLLTSSGSRSRDPRLQILNFASSGSGSHVTRGLWGCRRCLDVCLVWWFWEATAQCALQWAWSRAPNFKNRLPWFPGSEFMCTWSIPLQWWWLQKTQAVPRAYGVHCYLLLQMSVISMQGKRQQSPQYPYHLQEGEMIW